MAQQPDPFRNATAVIPKVRVSVITGGAAGNHTLTGIDLETDRLISVHAIATSFTPVGTLSAVVTGFNAGKYTVTAGDDTANTVSIPSGLTAPDAVTITIIRSTNVVSSDPDVTISGANIVVADGATYVLTNGDEIHWFAYDASDRALTPTFTGTAGTPANAGSNLTTEFSITADNTINNTGGTATTGDVLLVVWYDHDWTESANAAWQA